jgi:hypothetical protein
MKGKIMKYLGIVKNKDCIMEMPDSFVQSFSDNIFEAVEVENTILLFPSPLDKKRLSSIEELTKQSIEEHRKSLEGLAHWNPVC